MSKLTNRVLMLVENNPYPFDRRVRNEAESLLGDGYEVTVVCPADRGQPWSENIGGVQVYRFPAPPTGKGILGYFLEYGYGTLVMLAYSIVLLISKGIGIIHAFNPPDTLFVLGTLAKLTGRRYVFDHRDPSPELFVSKFGSKGKLIYRLLVWLEKTCCRQADLVLVPNESCRDLVVARHGLPASRVVVLRNDPRLADFESSEVDRELRGKASNIIAYAGHISSQDGVDHLLHALSYLKQKLGRSDFHAVIIGPADNQRELLALTAELKLVSHVSFTGKLPFGSDLLRYLATADICVEPAPSSPINNISTMVKIMEYMALGKPIVAYDLPENRVSAADAALFARPNDEADFAAKIACLMENPSLRQRLGAIGRSRVQEHLNWEHSTNRLLAAYRSVDSRIVARRTAGKDAESALQKGE